MAVLACAAIVPIFRVLRVPIRRPEYQVLSCSRLWNAKKLDELPVVLQLKTVSGLPVN